MFLPSGYSLKIFQDRYAFDENETWPDACKRLARQMSIPEVPDKQRHYFEKFYEILVDNTFVPGGRIWYNSGRLNPSLLNCFVMRNELDSKLGWSGLASDIITTSMSGGGCGVDFSDVRPSDSPITGHRGTCPGPVSLMKLINGLAEPIRAGGSRRVAMMFSLNLEHPDIISFLNSKLQAGELSFANISVISDKTKQFIKAVQNEDEWELSWNNRFKTKVNAKELWDVIVRNAYYSAEPGLLNREFAEEESTISYINPLVTTNPCGELFMTANESCDLGSVVLSRFVRNNELDWHELGNVIHLGVRFLDNVLSVNYYPLIAQKEVAHKLRRIGLGVTALADTLVLLGYKYGSEKGNKFVDKLFRFISKVAYESSIMLAIEKGAFPLCKPEKHVETGFVSRMPKKIKSLILEHGIRNCALLTCPPTGTVSIVSGNCSSGIEPTFAPAYKRNFYQGDQRVSEVVFHPLFAKFLEEGRDLSNFVSSRDLSVEQHLEIQRVIQQHVDGAISKTVNIPEDYPLEDMSKMWFKYLPELKGTTFYRENTRGFVDKDGKPLEPPLVALNIEDAKRQYNNSCKQEAVEVKCRSGICEL